MLKQYKIIQNIEEINNEEWDQLSGGRNPFLRHAFFRALEKHNCIGEKLGWLPSYIVCYENNRLHGAVPMFVKYNSYGELVFDWNWADAYQRSGLAYYPKLVAAVPYTPVTAPRLLVNQSDNESKHELITYAKEFAKSLRVSSLHWLFPDGSDLDLLLANGFLKRMDIQFHWQNQNYEQFEHFTAALTAKKRKNINRERRLVNESDLQIEILHGPELDAKRWRNIYPFYRDTFLKKGGIPTLSESFFVEVSRTMSDSIVVFAAQRHGEYVAAAICFKSENVLYGRHWGSHDNYDSLHFELCYYQGIEYAIQNKLERFEPGAQGEHKLSRGFMPTPVYSAHWIAHPQFHVAIERYLQNERALVLDQINEYSKQSPYRHVHSSSE